MYKPRFQIKMIRDMAAETLRLAKLYVTKSDRTGKNHFQFDWQMNATTGTFGRPFRLVQLKVYTNDPSARYLPTVNVEVKRDIFDQVMDTIGDIVHLFRRNVFVEGTCTHPHDQVHIEWDGDKEYGYWKQHVCYKCGGYVHKDDVDRYLPEDQRHPDMIKGNPVNPECREESIGEKMWNDAANGRIEPEDDLYDFVDRDID